MKRNVFTMMLMGGMLTCGVTMAQGLVSFVVQPANPTVADTVKLEADLWFPSGPCWIDHQSITVDSNDIRLDGCFNSGMLTVICNYTDVRTLGILAPGTYTALYSACYPFPVPSWYDTATVSFTVSPVTGQSPPEKDEVFSIYPNPASERVFLNIPGRLLQQPLFVEIVDVTGRCCMRTEHDPGGKLLELPLQIPRGQYFIILRTTGPEVFRLSLIIL